MDARFHLTGTLLHVRTRQPLPDLRVEVWDRDLLFDDFLGSETSGGDGRFAIRFGGAHHQEKFVDRRPDVFFRVYDGDRLVLDTSRTLVRRHGWHPHDVVLEVDLPLQGAEEPPLPDRDTILALDDVADRTPDELREERPALYGQLEARALDHLRALILRGLGGAAESVRRHFAGLDLRPLTDPVHKAQPLAQLLQRLRTVRGSGGRW